MTNYLKAKRNGLRGSNQKDGGRSGPVAQTGFWGVENFIPTSPNNWLFTLAGIDCPVFKVTEGDNEITATLEGGEIEATFTNAPHADIQDFLNDLSLQLIRLQADVDAPLDWRPLIVNEQEIGPEVAF